MAAAFVAGLGVTSRLLASRFSAPPVSSTCAPTIEPLAAGAFAALAVLAFAWCRRDRLRDHRDDVEVAAVLSSGPLRVARNIAIIALIAVPVAFLPAGGQVADGVLAALLLGFLAAIGLLCFTLYRQQQLTLSALPDARKAVLYGAIGTIFLMIAGQDELLGGGGGGAFLWVALVAISGVIIFAVWREANTY